MATKGEQLWKEYKESASQVVQGAAIPATGNKGYDAWQRYKASQRITPNADQISKALSALEQDSNSDARSGMRAYEDEYRAYQEEQARKGQKMHIAADMLSASSTDTFYGQPMAGFLNMLGDMISIPEQRGITDHWTDQQKHVLGNLQNIDPREARRYAWSINRGEDPYQLEMEAEKEEQTMLAMDLDALKREIEELEDQYWNFDYEASTFRGRMEADPVLRRMEKEISDKQQLYNRAKRLQDSAAYTALKDNEDFAEKSGYESTFSHKENPKLAWDLYQLDYDDPVYEYINNTDDIRKTMQVTHAPGIKSGYGMINEDEVAIYNYLYATQGKEAAQAYLDTIEDTLNERRGEEIFQGMKGNTAKELLFGGVSGLVQPFEGISNFLNVKDDYIVPSANQVASSLAREDLDEAGFRLPEWLGGGSLGQVGFDVISTAANMAPSIMTSWAVGMLNPMLGQAVGTSLMGASAAGNAYQEALNSGYTREQARAYSALVGGSEAGMEYLLGGISALGGKVPETVMKKILGGVDNAFARTAIQLGGNMLSEGFEEGLQEILTPWFKNLALHADEDINWNEVAYSSLLGALSAGLMESPGAVSGTIRTYRTGNELAQAGITPARLAEVGKMLPSDSGAYQLAQRVNENSDAYTVGRLFNEIGEEVNSSGKGMQPYQKILWEMAGEKAAAENRSKEAPGLASENGTIGTGGQEGQASGAGKARLISTNTDVDVRDFSEVKNGKATIQLQDGEVADMSNVSFATEADAVVFETVAALPGVETEIANEMLRELQSKGGTENPSYMRGVQEAYAYGYYGAQRTDVGKPGTFSGDISTELQKLAFDFGRKQRSARAAAEQARVTAAKKMAPGLAADGMEARPGKAGKYKKIVFEGDVKKLTGKNKAEIGVMDFMASEFAGTAVHVYRSYKNRKGQYVYRDSTGKEQKAPNGKYVNGEIWVDLNAGDKGEGLVLNTFAHEMYHHIEQWSPEKARALAEFLVQELGMDSVEAAVDRQIAKAEAAGLGVERFKAEGMTETQAENTVYDRAMSDFVADALETMFTRGDITAELQRLRQTDKSLFDKLKDFVSKWLKKLESFYKEQTISQEGAEVAQLEKFREIQRMFAEAMAEAGENYRAAGEQKSTTGEVDENSLYSIRNNVKDVNGNVYRDVVELEYKTFNRIRKSTKAYIDFIRNNLIKQKITVYNSNGEAETIEFAKTNERVQKDGTSNFRRVLGELERARGDVKKLIITNAEEVAEISDIKNHSTENSHQWLDLNGWDERWSYVMTQDGTIYPVILHIAKTRDGRNLLYSVNVDITKGIGIDKGATSAQAGSQVQQAVKVPTPSEKTVSQPEPIVKDEIYSLRNEEVDTSPRGILSRIDLESRTRKAEKDHLGRYQERVRQLEEKESRLEEVKSEIQRLSADEKQNRQALTDLRNEERNLNTAIRGLSRDIRAAEQSDMFKKIVAEERLKLTQRQSRDTLREYKTRQAQRQSEYVREYRAIREELTGQKRDTAIMEKEFIRLAKQFEQQTARAEKAAGKDAQTIADLRAALKAEAQRHREDQTQWQTEFNRLLREYEASGRQIERMEQTIQRQRENARARVEGRRRTEMRHKIQSKADELNKLLLKGGKERNVPVGLQKAVAAILDSINMEVRNAEQREKTYLATLARYDRMIATEANEAIRNGLIEKRAIYASKGDQFAAKMNALKKAYDEIQNDDDPLMASAYDEGLSEHLDTLLEKVGDTPLGQMSMEQLQCVYEVLTAVQATVRNANRTLAAEKEQGILELSTNAMREVRTVGGHKKYGLPVVNAIKKFGWNNMKPVYAFETIGSKVLSNLFANVRKGEDSWARDVTEAREFYLDQRKKYGADRWDMEKEYTFTSSSGMQFRLNLEQIMSLYAYAKREQAADHLRRGGIVIDESTEVTVKTKLGIPVKFNPTEATAYNISDDTLGEMILKLTPEQRAFVDEMQRYLSDTMGAKGNEVSVKMYGIKLFKEKNYFPLKSATQFMAKAKEQQWGDVKVKNSGFTKETAPRASNPIVLTPFMEVWARHVDEMSMYHSFVLPLEDFYRVYNYRTATSEETATQSVQMAIQNAYGKGASDYIDQLLRDLNGGARVDNTTGVINTMLNRFKKGAVFASASVVIQQPSAICRAAALIDPKYFIGPRLNAKRHDAAWAEVKKYAPVATIKEMGYFDTHVGKSTVDFITGVEYSGIQEKAKAIFMDGDYRDEVLSKAPAYADELTWVAIWNAVKRETNAKFPNADTKGEMFLRKCGERFTEVIVKTQVYDSVLSRSGNMRSKDTGMKMATAFMSEPTTSINMVADAILQAKRGGNKVQCRKAIGAVVASQIFNSILVSFVYSARDDDEEKTYGEKYFGNLVKEVWDSLNPMGYIPFLRDVQSIAQGYDVERADMSVISDLWKAWESLKSEKVTPWKKVENFVGTVCQLFGFPAKNILRDVRSAYQTITNAIGGEDSTVYGYGAAVYESLTGDTMNNQEQLYNALVTGDKAHVKRVRARYEDDEAADSALRSEIRKRFIDSRIDKKTARNYLMSFLSLDVNEVYWTVREWEYAKLNGTTDGYSKYDELYEAVETGEKMETVIDRYLHYGVTKAAVKSQLTEHFREEYLNMDDQQRRAVKDNLIQAYVKCGETVDDAEYTISKWEFEDEYDFRYEDRKSLYLSGEITREQLLKAMVDFGGYSRENADAKITEYEWDSMGYDISASRIAKYKQFCESAGVDKATFARIVEYANNTSNDVDPKTGKTIYYSAVKKIMAEINRLNIPTAQKEAIALSLWTESTVKKYKLW